ATPHPRSRRMENPFVLASRRFSLPLLPHRTAVRFPVRIVVGRGHETHPVLLTSPDPKAGFATLLHFADNEAIDPSLRKRPPDRLDVLGGAGYYEASLAQGHERIEAEEDAYARALFGDVDALRIHHDALSARCGQLVETSEYTALRRIVHRRDTSAFESDRG